MQLKHILGFGVFVFSIFPALAQHTLSGQIQEIHTENPIPGAQIYISGLDRGTTADFNGNFKIRNIKPGNYLIEVSEMGYKSTSKHIDIRGNTTISFELKPSVTELSDVIVTGVGRSTMRKRSPVAIKALDENALKQNSATNLIDGLKSVPGVSQITTGASISKPIIRGLGFNRILTLNNGIRQEGQQWGDEHGIEIDEYAVDRVEIIKGPGSLIYGSDGIAGVLNFLPPRSKSNNKVSTQILTNYQSNNNLLGYSVTNSGNKNGFQWRGRFSNKYANAYRNKYDGYVYNSGFKEFNGDLFIGLNKDWGHTYLTLNSFNTQVGIVEGDRNESGRFIFENGLGEEVVAQRKDFKGYRMGFPNQKINHFSVASNNYFKLHKGDIKADFGFQTNSRKEFEEAETPKDVDMGLRLNTFTYNVRYNLEEIRGWETTFGIGGMYQSNTNKGEEFLIPDYHLFDVGGFLFTQKAFDKLTVAGGLRFDNRVFRTNELYLNQDEEPVTASDPEADLKFEQIHRNFNGISASIGLSYQTSEQSTVKLNFSRGYRAPNIAELASNGKHEGTFRYELGNSKLKSENSNQIDLGYYLDTEHLTFEVTPFINFIEDYVFIRRLSEEEGNSLLPPHDDSVLGYEYTSGDAVLYGGELYLDIHPHPFDWLHFDHSFSYVRGKQYHRSRAERNLPSIPAPRYNTNLRAQFDKVGKTLSNAYFKVGLTYNFKQNDFLSAFDTETYTSSYTVWNLGVGLDIKSFGKKDFMNLYVNIDNLFDKAYQNHLSRLKYAPLNEATGRVGVYNMGRNISVKLIFNL